MSAQEKISRIVLAEDDAKGACIKVVGVGGGGGNAITRMMEAGLHGVEFIAVNTDLQALKSNLAPVKIQIGGKLTKGLGAGANPDIGRQAAVDDTEKLADALEGADMVFIAAGLGGGTGTGAAPVVASITGQLGGGENNLLTVAVVTMPFRLEGKRRMDQALDGLARLRESVDSVIVIPNDRLRETVARQTPVSEAFRMADDVIRQAVQGISDIITIPGLVNLDFADVRAVMKNMGAAVMGTGIAEGDKRAIEAARRAIENPLLDDSSIEGARGIIVNITGGPDLSLDEASEATEYITRAADSEANVIYGIVIDDQMRDKVKVTVIATGFRRPALPVTPVDLSNYRFSDGTTAPNQAPAPPLASSPAVQAQAAGAAPRIRRPSTERRPRTPPPPGSSRTPPTWMCPLSCGNRATADTQQRRPALPPGFGPRRLPCPQIKTSGSPVSSPRSICGQKSRMDPCGWSLPIRISTTWGCRIWASREFTLTSTVFPRSCANAPFYPKKTSGVPCEPWPVSRPGRPCVTSTWLPSRWLSRTITFTSSRCSGWQASRSARRTAGGATRWF